MKQPSSQADIIITQDAYLGLVKKTYQHLIINTQKRTRNMESKNFGKELSRYKVYLGKWINNNTPIFMFICLEKDVAEDKQDLLETYIMIPKNGYELLDKQTISIDSSLSDDIFCEEIRIATSRIES